MTSGPQIDCVQVLRRPASYEQAQSLTSDLHTMAMELQDRELNRLETVRIEKLAKFNPLLLSELSQLGWLLADPATRSNDTCRHWV